MNRNDRTGSHLFFIEFIIVLFFFLIVSTVCLRLFARAHGITQQADALSHAQAAAASVAAAAEDILADTPNISPGKADAAAQTESKADAGADNTVVMTGGTENNTDRIVSAAADSVDTESFLQTIASYLPGASIATLPDDPAGQEGLVIFYNRDFQTCTADEARYLLIASLDPPDGQNEQSAQSKPTGQNDQSSQNKPAGQNSSEETLHISVTGYDHAPVYELSVTLHRPATRKEALQ